jgi:hypothetical protein
MALDLGDPARWRDSLPARQPASSEVAAGAVAGVVGGLVAWGAAMALAGEALGGLYGPSAVAPDNVGLPVFVGALLVAFAAVTYGLVFVSILRPAAPLRRALGVGVVYGAFLYVPAWLVIVHLFDPMLYQAGEGKGSMILALHVLYGATLGFLVPFLRKILP